MFTSSNSYFHRFPSFIVFHLFFCRSFFLKFNYSLFSFSFYFSHRFPSFLFSFFPSFHLYYLISKTFQTSHHSNLFPQPSPLSFQANPSYFDYGYCKTFVFLLSACLIKCLTCLTNEFGIKCSLKESHFLFYFILFYFCVHLKHAGRKSQC